jgi:hypothetical protein
MEGVPAVILGMVTIFYLTDWPQDAHWLHDEELAWIKVDEGWTPAQITKRSCSAETLETR